MTKSALVGLVLVWSGGTASDLPAATACKDRTPTTWDITITDKGEPGTPMVLTGTVFDGGSGEPAPGVTVYVYHTDAEGYYSANRGMNNRDPRLCGILRTNDQGGYRVRTIRPADYASGGVRAHVHFQTWGDDLEREVHLLQFAPEVHPLPKDGLGGSSGDWVSGRVRPVYRDEDGVLHVRRDLRIRR